MASVPHRKCNTRRVEVYSRSVVEAILFAPRQPRKRMFLMTAYTLPVANFGGRHRSRPEWFTFKLKGRAVFVSLPALEPVRHYPKRPPRCGASQIPLSIGNLNRRLDFCS